MVLAEFLEALVRTAGKLMNTSKAGKQALKDGQLGEGFNKLINTYILPLAVRARPRSSNPRARARECTRESDTRQRQLMQLLGTSLPCRPPLAQLRFTRRGSTLFGRLDRFGCWLASNVRVFIC